MKAVIQRVRHADVRVGKRVAGKIDQGTLVLLGVHRDDTEKDVAWMAEKPVHLRIFGDDNDQMNQLTFE